MTRELSQIRPVTEVASGVPFTQPQPLIHSRHHRVVRSENLRDTVHSAFAHFARSRVSVRELAGLPRRLAAFGISR